MTFDQILQLIMGSAGVLVALVLGLKWLDKDRNRVMLEWKDDRKLLIEERNSRLLLIEKSNERCAEDRVLLHKKLDEQEKLIRSLLVNQATHAHQRHPALDQVV